VLRLHWLAKTYHSRPSEIAGIANTWLAYQFDGAVGLMGGFFEDKANEHTGQGKDRRRRYSAKAIIAMLERGIQVVEGGSAATSRAESAPEPQFADPATLLEMPGLTLTYK
jgi:hypothetical protein